MGRKFRKRKQLYDRNFTVHDPERKSKYACARCSAKFVTPAKLKIHMRRHDGYECSNCDFKAETWSTIRRHKAKAHRVMHKCTDCQKEFSSSCKLKKHQRIHQLPMECPVVGCDVEKLPHRIAKHVEVSILWLA